MRRSVAVLAGRVLCEGALAGRSGRAELGAASG